MTLRPEYRTYHFAGYDEHVLCLGAGCTRQILIVPPLFDEMNRVRRMLLQAMRALAARGVGGLLIDLPGCNESLAALESQSLSTWRAAVATAADQLGATHVASLRGGALIDDGIALPHWRLAPAKGASLLKTMIRTRIAGDRERGKTTSEAELFDAAKAGPVELAGNMLGPDMVAGLAQAEPAALPDLTLRALGQDITGSTLWLRAEPQEDTAMSAAIAADLDLWSASCGG